MLNLSEFSHNHHRGNLLAKIIRRGFSVGKIFSVESG